MFVRVNKPDGVPDDNGGKGGWWTVQPGVPDEGRPGRKGKSKRPRHSGETVESMLDDDRFSTTDSVSASQSQSHSVSQSQSQLQSASQTEHQGMGYVQADYISGLTSKEGSLTGTPMKDSLWRQEGGYNPAGIAQYGLGINGMETKQTKESMEGVALEGKRNVDLNMDLNMDMDLPKYEQGMERRAVMEKIGLGIDLKMNMKMDLDGVGGGNGSGQGAKEENMGLGLMGTTMTG